MKEEEHLTIWQWFLMWKNERQEEYSICLWYIGIALIATIISIGSRHILLGSICSAVFGSSIMFIIMKNVQYKEHVLKEKRDCLEIRRKLTEENEGHMGEENKDG